MVGKSRIEFCDLIKGEKDFIHVKYYSGSQSMSHLFSQGFVSSELFISDSEFRQKVNEKLPVHIKLPDHIPRPDAKIYKVVFAIATNKRIPEELPLFSKINLKTSKRVFLTSGMRLEFVKYL